MVKLDRKSVHSGRGIIKYEGRVVGKLDEVNFIFERVGLKDTNADNREICYGTVLGVLEDKSLIVEFNTKEPPTVSLEISVGNIKLVLEGVEFIDDIPLSGVMKDIEFHGTVASMS